MFDYKLFNSASLEELAQSFNVDPELFDGSKTLCEMAFALGIRKYLNYQSQTLGCTAKEFFENVDGVRDKFIFICSVGSFSRGENVYRYIMDWSYFDIGDGEELQIQVYAIPDPGEFVVPEDIGETFRVGEKGIIIY